MLVSEAGFRMQVSRVQHVLVGLFSLVVGAAAVTRADMTIRVHVPQRHDRFYSGSDKAFLGQAYDWSGVGKSTDSRWVTMISPSYFLSAAHYTPNGNVTFYEGNDVGGPSHTYSIASGVKVGATDLWLGKLSTTLDPSHNIAYYPILMLGADSLYPGIELYNYGQQNRVGRNVIDDNGIQIFTEAPSTGMSMYYDYDNNDVPSVGGDETFLIPGDSGGPSFAVWNNELALLGIHWFNGYENGEPRQSGDTFVPAYFNDIRAGMGSESPTAVPEPSTMVLVAVGGLAALLRHRRRRRSVGGV